MPTKTYEHLPPEKKERLLAAIRQELQRVPFEQVSINRIVQTAGISRGSFYQYFSGKEELCWLVLEDFRSDLYRLAQESVAKHQGNLFLLTLDLFDGICSYGTTKTTKRLFQNLFNYLRSVEDFDPTEEPQLFTALQMERLGALLHPEDHAPQDPSECFLVVDVLSDLLRSALARVWVFGHPEEEARQQLERKLQLVRTGIGGKGE